MKWLRPFVTGLATCLAAGTLDTVDAGPAGSAFTCHGRLTAGGSAADGYYDFELELFDAVTDGNQVGTTQLLTGVSLADGSFTVSLDFGPAAVDGGDRWLEIGVRPSGSKAAFATFAPRQELGAPFRRRLVPAGAIVAFGGGQPPNGWLLADGAEVSRATYAELFAAIGETYGSGDGSTTFNLPDLRQRFPIGRAVNGTASVLGETGGAIDHAHAYSAVPEHAHSVDPPSVGTDVSGGHLHAPSTAWGFAGTPSGGLRRPLFDFKVDDAFDPEVPVVASSGAHGHQVDIAAFNSAATGVVTGATNAVNPPYVTVNYIIKH